VADINPTSDPHSTRALHAASQHQPPCPPIVYFLPSCAATHHDEFWHVDRVSQEGAEKAHGAQLHREAEPVVLPATNIDQLSVGGIEVEVAVQLSPGGITGVAAVAPLLLGGEELRDHQVLGAWVSNHDSPVCHACGAVTVGENCVHGIDDCPGPAV